MRYPVHLMEVNGYATKDAGTSMGGHDNIWENGSLAFSSESGLHIVGENNAARNLTIHDVAYRVTGTAGGIETPYNGNTRGIVIEHNTITRSGREGICHASLAAGAIRDNHISHVGLLSSDLGGIYAWDTDGEGTEIAC